MGDNADRLGVYRVRPLSVPLDALPRAVIVADMEMVVTGWNAHAETLYGWTAAEAIGRVAYDLITPPEMVELAHSVMAFVIAGDSWTGDFRVVRKDGTQRIISSLLNPLFDDDGQVVGALCEADDVTDLRRQEREAGWISDHLLLALAAGNLGTWRWDRVTGITIWDDAMCALFGLKPGEFDGTFDAWRDNIHPDDVVAALQIIDHAIEQRSAYAIEHRVIWPDGSVHWVDGRGMVILDADGESAGTIGCVTDITDRKLAEFAAQRRAADAEQLAVDESRQRDRLEFLVELNDLSLDASDHLDLMRRSALAAVPRLGDWCIVHFAPQPGVHQIEVAHKDPQKAEWARSICALFPVSPDAGFGAAAVIRSGRTEFFPHVDRYRHDPDAIDRELAMSVPAQLRDVVEAVGMTSIITAPLRTKRGVIGAIQFVTAESGRRYGDDDVALAEAAAGRVAAAIDNAWLSEQQREIAATLQAALLPTELPEIPGLEVAVRYWAAGAASDVGGDFFDVFALGDNRWAVVVGDVCGNGAQAAAVTSVARHTIRAAALHGASPTEVLEWVNTAVLAAGDGRFCTLVYTVIEPVADGAWRATTVVGGHPLPVVIDAAGDTSALGVHGTLIGALPRIRVTTVERILAPGTTIVAYTDGVNDVRPPHDLDDAALHALVASAVSAAGTAEEVADRLGHAIEALMPIPERNDDVALVVIRFD